MRHPNIDVNKINTRDKKTALIVASDKGHRDIVELLLRHTQIDVNKIDSFGETALMKASWKVYIRVVKLLLRCSETDVSQEYIGRLEESGAREIVELTPQNDLWFALRGAGTSFGVVTEFLYTVHPGPETLPVLIPVMLDSLQVMLVVSDEKF